MSTLKGDLRRLEEHYAALFVEHGDTAAAVQQRDRETQERRMRRLCEIGDVSQAQVLDFGCGSGHLLSVLRSEFGFSGAYVGYDLSEPHLAAGRLKFPDATFERRDIFEQGIDRTVGYVMISGVFNNRMTDNWGFMTAALERLYGAATEGVAFNCLSTYVDYEDPNLYYADPREVFDFCKRRLSPFVNLRHDYRIKPNVIPFEFTVYVYRDR